MLWGRLLYGYEVVLVAKTWEACAQRLLQNNGRAHPSECGSKTSRGGGHFAFTGMRIHEL